ncbi:MAG: ATPase, T2SS/T4P/T4SS family [Pseudomonadota bacterium]
MATQKKSQITSQAELDPKDKPLAPMHDWCEKHGDLIVLNSGLILTSELSSRNVQNCKILMRNMGLRFKQVKLASQELIELLIANKNEEQIVVSNDPADVSIQQQRLRMLVREAVLEKVSDIHIQVRQDMARVRFRKHGELFLYAEWVPKVAREIAAVAFNKETDHAISHFNPLIPQGASMPMFIDGMEIRLRLASMPAHGGFDMVMRVLSLGDEQIPSLSELGYTPAQLQIIEKAVQMPHGAILIAGPTGSGKTTTLASAMQFIHDEKKIYTIEDPVEKVIPNATQVPINTEKEDRGFANMGRASLRMDPDVIVLGELRDADTASVLVRAAITGHLVFTTIHTNSALNIITRLVDLGVSQVMLGDKHLLVCLIFQRLVPKLCDVCAQPLTDMEGFDKQLPRWQAFFKQDFIKLRVRGKNCEACHGSGIAGRQVIAEVVWIDEPGRQFIQKCDTLGWHRYLREHGWQSYRDHAIELVRQGICDPVDAEKIIGEINSSFTEAEFNYQQVRGELVE